MAKIKSFSNLSNLDTFETFQRFLCNYLDNISNTVNGQLDFHQNIRSTVLTTLTFANSSEIKLIPHNLGVVPKGILTVKLTAAAILYAPQGDAYAWTSTNIYLQSSAAVTASIYII